MSAAGALIEMPAECGGTTPANGQQHFDVLPPEPVAISFDERISRGADQIGHLKWWPGHLLFLRRTAFERQRIQRTRGRMQVTLGEMQIAGGYVQTRLYIGNRVDPRVVGNLYLTGLWKDCS